MMIHDAHVPSLAEFEGDLTTSEWDESESVPAVTYDRTEMLDAVFDAYLEATKANWDGEGAAPVVETVLQRACQFVLALPIGAPEPETEASPLGTILFTWYSAPRRNLTVDLDARGEIAYAALLGLDRHRGTCLFTGSVPSEVLRLAALAAG